MRDYHIHSDYSADGKQTIKEILSSAKKAGMEEIAITDHIDFKYPYPGLDFYFDAEKRDKEIESLKDEFPNLNVVKGIEVGLTPETLDDYVNYFKQHAFDFIIASTHVVDGDDPYYPKYFKGKTIEQAYTKYLESRLACLKNYTDYSVVGHIGYVSRFPEIEDKIIKYNDYVNLIDEILKTAIKDGKGIEINTKGIGPTGDTLPGKTIIKRYKELGGEIITVGSDAHESESIGGYIKETYDVLKAVGFKYVTTFKKLKPSFKKI